MSKRLQVLLDESEFQEVEQLARANHMTVAEWVRQALRAARRDESHGNVSSRLEAVRAAARCDFPTADVERMLIEIEKGYLR